jgi:hypothetical protein
MATRLKTVQYAFPALASMTNNTLTNLTQITVYLPESGSKTIRATWLEVSMDDIITVTGGSLTTKTINLRLNAVAYSSTTNASTLTHSGENMSPFITRDFSSYFATNWTGTSMTCDVQMQINQSTGTTTGMVNVCATLHITYEYDDTSATQLKTVYIPLNAPVTTLPITKTSHDTTPALDAYLPEASKTFRNIHIITQANANQVAATDHTVTYELTSLGTTVTGNYESTFATDRWTRYVWYLSGYITTNVTHTFNVWSSLTARHHSMQAWMVVTYEFDSSTTTSVMNSLLLPMEVNSPVGTSSTIFQRATREIMVQETNPVLSRLAPFVRWNNVTNETGLNARVGTGSFIAYTNTGSGVIAGGKGMMVRNDAPTELSFTRGKNILQMDIYNTSANGKGGNFGVLWMLNYTSDVASSGVGSHNHSIIWPLAFHGTGVATLNVITATTAPIIPESNYYISALGLHLGFMNNGTNVVSTPSINIERVVAEGGLIWECGYSDAGINDTEVGYNESWSQTRSQFKRWIGDTVDDRMDIETSRRYGLYIPNQTVAATAAFWETFQLYMTYHSIAYTVSGTISGSAGGTVTIKAYRTGTSDLIYITSRVGDGAYSFTWYDNITEIYIEAYEDITHRGRSINATAGTTMDIALSYPSARAFA